MVVLVLAALVTASWAVSLIASVGLAVALQHRLADKRPRIWV